MRHRAVRGGLLALFSAVACATGHGPSRSAPTPASGISLTVPGSIGGFHLADRETYDDPGAGYRLRYVGPDSMYADVFVYPGPRLPTPCDSVVANAAADAQVGEFRTAFPSMIAQHYVDSISVVRDERLRRTTTARWCAARHLTLAVVREARPQHSDFYLYVLSGYFVKVRVTYPFSTGRLALEDAFIGDLFTRLRPSGRGPPPDQRDLNFSSACFDSLPYGVAHPCDAFTRWKTRAHIGTVYAQIRAALEADSLSVETRDSSDIGFALMASAQVPHGACAKPAHGPDWVSPSIGLSFSAERFPHDKELRYFIAVHGAAVAVEGNVDGSMVLAMCFLGRYAHLMDQSDSLSGPP